MFTSVLVKIKNRMEFLPLGRVHFIFCPCIYVLSPPGREVRMAFHNSQLRSCFVGHFLVTGGAGRKVREKGFKMLSGWPWGVKML